jgi:hypothetical protein
MKRLLLCLCLAACGHDTVSATAPTRLPAGSCEIVLAVVDTVIYHGQREVVTDSLLSFTHDCTAANTPPGWTIIP